MTVEPELQSYLDGQIPPDALSERARGEAAVWETIQSLLAAPSPAAPPDLIASVMQRIQGVRPRAGVLGWMIAPRPLRPALVFAAGAAAVLLAVALTRTLERPGEHLDSGLPQPVYVQFVLTAPAAKSVAVAGDFNAWARDLVLEDADGDGIWTGVFPLPPGIHKYMFLVDGERWLTDPFAAAYVDDGFGGKNAILQVVPSDGRQI